MAYILIDTCVLTDLADPNSPGFEWSADTLERLDQQHAFIINPINNAEYSVAFKTIEETESFLKQVEFVVHAISKEALFVAGKAFFQYKKC